MKGEPMFTATVSMRGDRHVITGTWPDVLDQLRAIDPARVQAADIGRIIATYTVT